MEGKGKREWPAQLFGNKATLMHELLPQVIKQLGSRTVKCELTMYQKQMEAITAAGLEKQKQ